MKKTVSQSKGRSHAQYIFPLLAAGIVAAGWYMLVYRSTSDQARFERTIASFPGVVKQDGTTSVSYIIDGTRVDMSVQYSGEKSSLDVTVSGDRGRMRIEQNGNLVRIEDVSAASRYASELSNQSWRLSEATVETLKQYENLWMSVSPKVLEPARTECPDIFSDKTASDTTQGDFNLTKTTIDEERGARIYTFGVDSIDTLRIPVVSKIVDRLTCLGELQKRDFKTRSVTSKDIGLWTYALETPLGSDRANRLTINQLWNVLNISLPDATQNVFIPDAAAEVDGDEILSSLPLEDQTLAAMLLSIFSVPERDGVVQE
jgi:hypothetical protein